MSCRYNVYGKVQADYSRYRLDIAAIHVNLILKPLKIKRIYLVNCINFQLKNGMLLSSCYLLNFHSYRRSLSPPIVILYNYTSLD